MAGEKWVMDLPYARVLREKFGNAQSIFILPLNTDDQSLQTAQQKKCGVRIHGAAEFRAGVADFLDELATAGYHAANQIRMSAQILGAGVQNEINPELRGALIHR